MDARPDTIKNIGSYYGIDAQKLQRHYKHKVSKFKDWSQLAHAEQYLIFAENVTEHLSIDEVSLSKGELYTFVTNKRVGQKNKNCIVAVINGTEASVIEAVLAKIPIEKRLQVKEVSMDMARNMNLAVVKSFPGAKIVIDRFHVVRLVMDAMQHLRVKLRFKAIEDQNNALQQAKEKGEKYSPIILSNGDTIKELLVRCQYLLYVHKEDWTANQAKRAAILFELFPMIQQAYKLTIAFRNIYKNLSMENALQQFQEWKVAVQDSKLEEFNTTVNSLQYHLDNILNFFINKSTNANAESFNAKIKNFRANLRGVTDVKFFLFRLHKLFS